MSAARPSKPADPSSVTVEPARPASRRIPHVVFGIGAFLLVVLAGITLIVLSGQLARNPSAVMVIAILVAVMIAFTILIASRWRRARLGRT